MISKLKDFICEHQYELFDVCAHLFDDDAKQTVQTYLFKFKVQNVVSNYIKKNSDDEELKSMISTTYNKRSEFDILNNIINKFIDDLNFHQYEQHIRKYVDEHTGKLVDSCFDEIQDCIRAQRNADSDDESDCKCFLERGIEHEFEADIGIELPNELSFAYNAQYGGIYDDDIYELWSDVGHDVINSYFGDDGEEYDNLWGKRSSDDDNDDNNMTSIQETAGYCDDTDNN